MSVSDLSDARKRELVARVKRGSTALAGQGGGKERGHDGGSTGVGVKDDRPGSTGRPHQESCSPFLQEKGYAESWRPPYPSPSSSMALLVQLWWWCTIFHAPFSLTQTVVLERGKVEPVTPSVSVMFQCCSVTVTATSGERTAA